MQPEATFPFVGDQAAATVPVQAALPFDGPPLPLGVPRLAARMINEYAYCPRLAYLERVQGKRPVGVIEKAWGGNCRGSRCRRLGVLQQHKRFAVARDDEILASLYALPDLARPFAQVAHGHIVLGLSPSPKYARNRRP